MPKQKSWFPQASMIELEKAISPILEGFKNIVGYGGSMGGYAAIKYSNLLNMNRVIAFVPQYSIDPEQVEDRRYAEFLMLWQIKTCKSSRKMWMQRVNT